MHFELTPTHSSPSPTKHCHPGAGLRKFSADVRVPVFIGYTLSKRQFRQVVNQGTISIFSFQQPRAFAQISIDAMFFAFVAGHCRMIFQLGALSENAFAGTTNDVLKVFLSS